MTEQSAGKKSHNRVIDYNSILHTLWSYLNEYDYSAEGLITRAEMGLVYNFITTHKAEFNSFLEREI